MKRENRHVLGILLAIPMALGCAGLPGVATPTPTPPPVPTAGGPVGSLTDEQIIAAVVAGGAPTIADPLVSPDGKTRAEIASYPCTPVGGDSNAYIELRLVDIASGETRVGESQLIYCQGLGASGIEGWFWSQNSQYFYYGPAEGGPDGCGYWTGMVTRLEAATLDKVTLNSPVLSPDKSRFAGWGRDPLAVTVLDVETGAMVFATPALESGPGPLAWSPDSQSLAAVQNLSFCPLVGPSDLTRFDLPDLASTTLAESDVAAYQSITWDDPARITLVDRDNKTWHFDIATGALEPAK